MAISTYLSIITLNTNRPNDPIKRYRVAEWIKKKDPSIHYLWKTHFRRKDMQTENEGAEKDIPCTLKLKESGVAIAISDKIDFKTKTVIKDKERHYIMIAGSIQ